MKAHTDLNLIDSFIFKPCELEITNIVPELESQEYSACNFKLNSLNIKFRKAKITPTKTGQFVTIWKRNENGITEPFNIVDNFDLYLIATQTDTKFGLFIFPKIVLHINNILSDKNKNGKRGIRVYPNWDLTTNKQSQKTQQWQTKYFVEISQNKRIDLDKVKKLFKLD